MAKLQDNFNGLDLDRIVRRGDRDASSAIKVPTELFQIAVFYSNPIINELSFWDNETIIKTLGKTALLDRRRAKHSLQDFKGMCEAQFENQRFIFPFYSPEIFTVQTDAINFAPSFIRKLIKEEKLPPEVVNEDNSLNDDLVRIGIVPLYVVVLERDDKTEFKV